MFTAIKPFGNLKIFGSFTETLFQGAKISEKKHQLRQRVYPSTPQCDDFEALRRVFERCIKEKQLKQTEEKKTQVAEKHQERQSNYQKYGGTTSRDTVQAPRDGEKQ